MPRGSEFGLELVFSVYEDEDQENFQGVFEALRLLEDNYLGGSGTRGMVRSSLKTLK